MSKLILGLLVGGLLGIFDGLTAWFTPDVRAHHRILCQESELPAIGNRFRAWDRIVARICCSGDSESGEQALLL